MTNLNSNNWILGNTTQSDFYLNKFNLFTTANVTKCPLDKPFVLNGTKDCTNCKGDLLFELSSETCVQCPKNTVYNSELHICASPVNGTTSINGTSGIVLPTGSCDSGRYYNETLKKCVCPSNAPYFDGKQCISCILPLFFNKSALKCDSCPVDQAYDIVKEICGPCPSETPVLINGICKTCKDG